MIRRPPRSTLFPYPTLSRSLSLDLSLKADERASRQRPPANHAPDIAHDGAHIVAIRVRVDNNAAPPVLPANLVWAVVLLDRRDGRHRDTSRRSIDEGTLQVLGRSSPIWQTQHQLVPLYAIDNLRAVCSIRSEERRVGKEC